MKRLSLFRALLVLCTGIPFAGSGRAEEDGTLTILVYMTGSDLESGYGAASNDLMEMAASGVGRNVHLIVMTGGSLTWDRYFEPESTCVSEVTARGLRVRERLGPMNMGEAETLSWFLSYGKERFPADEYALILWDHGGGPMNGVCYDELNDYDCLTVAELRAALEESPFGESGRLSWIGFDACLMASVETAAACAPYAEYMIASGETEPDTGWDYGFLGDIRGEADGAGIGRHIIDRYFASFPNDGAFRLTLALMDLEKIRRVEDALDSMFSAPAMRVDENSFSVLSNRRRDSEDFGRASAGAGYDLVDLYSLAEHFMEQAPEEASELMEAIEAAVVYQRSSVTDVRGLTVYYPCYNGGFFQDTARRRYEDLGFADSYFRYLDAYARVWFDEPLADYSDIAAEAEPEAVDGIQTVTVNLSEAQASNFASAELYIMAETFVSGTYRQVYVTNESTLEDGVLSAQYGYDALYYFDKEGQPISEPVMYTKIEDTYCIRAMLSHVPGDWTSLIVEDEELLSAWLLYREDGNGRLTNVGIIPLEKGQTYMEALGTGDDPARRQSAVLDSDTWKEIILLHFPMAPVYDEAGRLQPYPEWPYSFEATSGFYAMEDDIELDQIGHLGFADQQYTGRNLYAQYVVYDTQGNRTATSLLPIQNSNVIQHTDVNAVLMDGENALVTLTDIDVVEASESSGVYLRLMVENRSDDLIYLDKDRLCINDTSLSDIDFTMFLQPGAAQSAVILIPPEKLPPLEDQRLQSLSMKLIVKRSYSEEIESAQVRADLDVDLSRAGVRAAQSGSLAEDGQDGVRWMLKSLETAGEDTLLAELYIVNESDEDLELTKYMLNALVNDCVICNSAEFEDMVVYAHSGGYLTMEIGLVSPGREDIYGRGFFDPANVPEYWGIRQLDTLSFLFLDGLRVDFSPGSPVSLTGKELHPESLLLDLNGIRVCARDLEDREGSMILWLTLANDTDRDQPLAVERVRLNGDAASRLSDYKIYLELGDKVAYGYFSETLPAHSVQRAAIELGTDVRPVRSLEVQFRLEDPGQPFGYLYTTDAQIDCAAMTAIPAEADSNPEMDPADLFRRDVSVPEDPGQYAMTLTWDLTREQAESFKQSTVILAETDGESYRWCASARPRLEEDNKLVFDFSGLLLCADGTDAPMTQSIRDDGIVPLSFYFDGSSLYDHGFLTPDEVLVKLENDVAWVESVTLSEPLWTQETFHNLISLYKMRKPVRQEDGTLAHFADWEAEQGSHGIVAPLPENVAGLCLKPARDFDLVVLLCITRQDGEGYTLEDIRPLSAFAGAAAG